MQTPQTLSPIGANRIVSLDAFRGFIMFSMLMSTFGLKELAHLPVAGFVYSQLSHVPWVGFHFEDVILPSFLFIIGVSLGLSDIRRRERGEEWGARFRHAKRRAVTLFALGFMLSWISAGKINWGPGVLQELALAYICAFAFLGLSVRGRFVAFAVLLFVYWFFIFIVPVPEAGRNSYEVFKNIVYWIDNSLTGSTSRWGYVYPIITSTAVVVYGTIVGELLLRRRSDRSFMRTLAIWGAIGVAAGLALHPVIPIIKRMFTSSYTLFTCGLASFMLLAFFRFVDNDRRQWWSFPFVVLA